MGFGFFYYHHRSFTSVLIFEVRSRRSLHVAVDQMTSECHVIPKAHHMTHHHATVFKHRVDLSLCYPLILSAVLEATTTNLLECVRFLNGYRYAS